MDVSMRYSDDFTVYVHNIPHNAPLPVGSVKAHEGKDFIAHEMKLGNVTIKMFQERKEDADPGRTQD